MMSHLRATHELPLSLVAPSHSPPHPSELAPEFDEHRVDRFGFGANWLDYQTSVTDARLAAARADLEAWLGTRSLAGKRVLDIGSGSGVHSLCLHAMGATELVSFDFDAESVEATARLHASAGAPASWTVRRGSVLDAAFISSLGTFDLVYSWGVLHHTGQMRQAIAHACRCVNVGGQLFISIYAKGPNYAADLALKQRYHAASLSGKRRMEFEWITERYALRRAAGQVPDDWWTEGRERGMDSYCDLVDWLGGLPYEVATADELITQLRASGIETRRLRECPGDGGCHILVGARVSDTALPAPVGSETQVRRVRAEWPSRAPVLWVGALDPTHGPERVVELAYSLPHVGFVMVSEGHDALDSQTRDRLSRLAPNLHLMQVPADGMELRAMVQRAGVVLHTAACGPSTAWIAEVAALGVPMFSLHDDDHGTLAAQRCGAMTDGDLALLAARLDDCRTNAIMYAKASLAGIVWSTMRVV
jgi:2-polyprenyl-3-methyl-5-hydroxy-6-metoxy-1,4-benzoquinol methylase